MSCTSTHSSTILISENFTWSIQCTENTLYSKNSYSFTFWLVWECDLYLPLSHSLFLSLSLSYSLAHSYANTELNIVRQSQWTIHLPKDRETNFIIFVFEFGFCVHCALYVQRIKSKTIQINTDADVNGFRIQPWPYAHIWWYIKSIQAIKIACKAAILLCTGYIFNVLSKWKKFSTETDANISYANDPIIFIPFHPFNGVEFNENEFFDKNHYN